MSDDLVCACASPTPNKFITWRCMKCRGHIPKDEPRSPEGETPSDDWKLNALRRAICCGVRIEVEPGAACIATFRGVNVTNGQDTVEECARDAMDVMWDQAGVMRPEFSARLRSTEERSLDTPA